MKNLAFAVKRFWVDEEGATAVEYAIMVAMIAVAIVAAVYLVGQKVENVFQQVCFKLNNNSNC